MTSVTSGLSIGDSQVYIRVHQAAVEDVGPLDTAHVVVNQSGAQRVGVAAATEFVLSLRDLAGNPSGQPVTFSLAPQAQRAVFLDELFSTLGDFQSTLKIRAGGSFTAIALQQTGLVLGTLAPLIP